MGISANYASACGLISYKWELVYRACFKTPRVSSQFPFLGVSTSYAYLVW